MAKKGIWRTVAGRRIFIEDGENISSAMAKSGKFKTAKRKNNNKDADKERMKEYAEEDDKKALDREAERQVLEAEMRARDSKQSKLDKVGINRNKKKRRK